jgi:peptidoglycan L-alanyl-D-glutamate endopeptidase CwlK
MGFDISKYGGDLLDDLHPDLARVVRRAAVISPFTFRVFCVARTIEEQAANVKKGVSKTMASRHIPANDGYVYAVDLVPWDGQKWNHTDWKYYFPLGEVMKQAAIAEKVPVEWGAVWDRLLNNLGKTEQGVREYSARMKAQGRKAFLDGPHFQLPKGVYPGTGEADYEAILASDDELSAVATEAPPIIHNNEPKLVTEVKKELREDGNKTVAEGDKVSKTGKIIVGTGAAVGVEQQTGVFAKLGAWFNDMGSLKYLVQAGTKVADLAATYWWVAILGVGFLIWQSGFRISFFRAQDTIEGKNVRN